MAYWVVVEIISPSSVLRDRVDKMRLYRQYEVWEYWLIDPQINLLKYMF
jgi:Uma2 family endonuclease